MKVILIRVFSNTPWLDTMPVFCGIYSALNVGEKSLQADPRVLQCTSNNIVARNSETHPDILMCRSNGCLDILRAIKPSSMVSLRVVMISPNAGSCNQSIFNILDRFDKED